MNRLLSFLLFFLFTVSCEAQKSGRIPLEIDGGPVRHFGDVSHKDRLQHNFVLRNNGSDTVWVEKVKAACGCTAVMVSGSTIAPGGNAVVSVEFVPPRTSNGHVSKSVSVYVKGTQRPVYVLRVEAEIQSVFEAMPELVDVGVVVMGRQLEATFLLKNISDENQSVLATQSAIAIEYRGFDGSAPPEVRPLDEVDIEPKEFELAPGASREITVRFTPPFGGKVMGSAVLYSVDETRQVEFTGMVKYR